MKIGNDLGSGLTAPSKYVQGVMTGLQVKNQFRNKLQGLVSSSGAQITAGDDDNYAARVLAGKKAARAAKDLVAGEVSAAETARLAKERQESGVENGKKLDGKAAGNSEAASTGGVAGKSGDTAAAENSSSRQIGEAAVSPGDSTQAIPGGQSQDLTAVSGAESTGAQPEAGASPDVASSDNVPQSSIDIIV